MQLSDYMDKCGLSDANMARLINRSRPTVSRLRRGVVRPDWTTLELIQWATDGQVTPNDFLPRRESKRRRTTS